MGSSGDFSSTSKPLTVAYNDADEENRTRGFPSPTKVSNNSSDFVTLSR